MSELFQRLVAARGYGQEFLTPRYEDCLSPDLLPDMKPAVERILRAIDGGEKILIYGDYDADGVTASTVMYDALKMAGAGPGGPDGGPGADTGGSGVQVEIMLPHRVIDGYGMSTRLVERAVRDRVGLVVTVDCGSRNNEIIAELVAAGVDVVVTDHHECGEELPDAVAIVDPAGLPPGDASVSSARHLLPSATAVVNPKRTDVRVLPELRDLAGVGVAFKVAQKLVELGRIPAGQEKWLLDMVVIGTLCDSMRMSAENRRLCYWGSRVLARTRRPGMQELMKIAGVKPMVDATGVATGVKAEAVGFQLGPRINAAGRMDSAEVALGAVQAENRAEGAERALELNSLNDERKKAQKEAVAEINVTEAEPVIVVAGDWHEGVLGIIAGRLVEDYHKPAFVLALTPEGVYKGSGRSFGEFNLAEALRECQNVIIRGGGHAEACGLTVAADRLDDFRVAVNEYYQGLKLRNQERFLRAKEDLKVGDVSEFSLDLLEELAGLEPFGVGNEEPIFLLPEVTVLAARKMGAEEQHLRLDLRDSHGHVFKVVAFYAPEEWLGLRGGESVNAWVRLVENEWNGTRSVEGRLVDLEILGILE